MQVDPRDLLRRMFDGARGIHALAGDTGGVDGAEEPAKSACDRHTRRIKYR